MTASPAASNSSTDAGPAYRWRCHRCQKINETGVERCGACGFAAIATGYEILGQEDPLSASMSESKQLFWERIARAIHLVVGSLFLGASGWSLFIAATFNPWVFWAGLLIGTALFGVGIFGSRKAVFELLYWGWV
jgi:hypothetical protein